MKKRLLLLLGATMILGCLVACGKKDEKKEDNTVAEKTEAQTYEFDTFDGAKVVINDSNIVSQEACDEPLEWADLPADAEQLAPGRDCILFATATNYYVEDATNKLVTVATREATESQSYEFDTFDGEKVVIDDSNIVSKEACEEPLEWAGLPADAEQIAPGRDCILFADSTHYYIEDATNKLVIVANK